MHLYKIVGNHIGIDPTNILTSVAVVWAAIKLWHQLYTTVNSLVRRHFMASIHIDGSDDIFLHMMEWLAQSNLFNSRFLKAETAARDPWKDEDESQFDETVVPLDGSVSRRQKGNVGPQFTPTTGTHSFRFEGRYFTLQRRPLLDPHGTPQGQECLEVSCYGRSPGPIKRLLQHAQEQYNNSRQGRTTVRCPINSTLIRYSPNPWKPVSSRPVRPMTTVVLDKTQKSGVMSDIHEFLLPGTARFYANRGIPLRRGYLFHGPPGTGKTSLSFALAGVFGLDIYIISLSDHTLTDNDLLALFQSLPQRCIVLLEDIDTAGLKRDEDSAADSSSPPSASKNGTEKSRISLSGLLNAIDGVASHEGHVLIMTTNKPDTLDEALIRSGRIDQRVHFPNANGEEAGELFVQMYEPDCIPREGDDLSQERSKLKGLAAQFASKIPPGEFSQAEIQGFLLTMKSMPQNAVAKAEEWVRERQHAREVGAKGAQ
ncbi:hypothetical protein N0V88_007352 [Collariella sp. IMI 366227]|nr:hypothetical protein N0V88_007352 [Collariella sp. IMI 366227]